MRRLSWIIQKPHHKHHFCRVYSHLMGGITVVSCWLVLCFKNHVVAEVFGRTLLGTTKLGVITCLETKGTSRFSPLSGHCVHSRGDKGSNDVEFTFCAALPSQHGNLLHQRCNLSRYAARRNRSFHTHRSENNSSSGLCCVQAPELILVRQRGS